jgi:hypothetical protein
MKQNEYILKKNNIDKIVKELDMSRSYKSIFSTLWYTSLPCFDLKGLTAHSDMQSSILKVYLGVNNYLLL